MRAGRRQRLGKLRGLDAYKLGRLRFAVLVPSFCCSLEIEIDEENPLAGLFCRYSTRERQSRFPTPSFLGDERDHTYTTTPLSVCTRTLASWCNAINASACSGNPYLCLNPRSATGRSFFSSLLLPLPYTPFRAKKDSCRRVIHCAPHLNPRRLTRGARVGLQEKAIIALGYRPQRKELSRPLRAWHAPDNNQ